MAQTIEGLKAAADTTKQIITLSTAVISLTVTFAKEFKTGANLSVPITLQISWFFFLFSIIGAIWTLMAITGSLSQIDRGVTQVGSTNCLDVNAANIRIPSLIMLLGFLIGLALTGVAGSSIVR